MRQRVEQLSRLKDLLESQLSATRLAYLDLGEPVSVDDFVAALPQDSVFVDYFVFDRLAANADSVAC